MIVDGKHPGQKNPNFNKIISLCQHELDIKYEQYGNTWLDMYPGYWDERLANEVQEFSKALQYTARKRKLLNIINIASLSYVADKGPKTNKIITLCGSTKFFETFDDVMLKLCLAGWIIFTIGTHRFSDHDLPEVKDKKDMLDEMHKRKIDMSSCILVIDVDGYVGKSTRSEIRHAIDTNKYVYYYSRNQLQDLLEKQ